MSRRATGSLPASAFGSGPIAAAAAGALADARARLGVKRTALFWLDRASGGLACVATAGADRAGGWLGQTLAAGVGMAGRAVKEGRPVWTPDLLGNPAVPIAVWLRERLEAEGLRTVAAAPVRMDQAIRGALGFLDGPGRTFDEEGLRRIGRLADEVGESLARAASAAP